MNLIKSGEDRVRANFILQMCVAAGILGLVFYCAWGVIAGRLEADSFIVGSTFILLTTLANFCFPSNIGAQAQQETIDRLSKASASPMTTTTVETTTDGRTDTSRHIVAGTGAGPAPVNAAAPLPDEVPWAGTGGVGQEGQPDVPGKG